MFQNITYTAFNKASQITEGDYEYNIAYAADDERFKTELINTQTNTTEQIKYYAGDYEEFRDASNNVMRRLHYINSPYGLVAVVEKTGTNYDVRYVMTDYLGSICAVTDDAGTVLQQVSFDAWGRRRDPQTWALYGVTNASPSALYFDRGYTGHEHLEKFDLINMNGRMYDPTLCRMLSVDNYNNNVSSTIGMNRYAYALNNPLKYTDPSGHFLKAASWLFFFSCTAMSSGGDWKFSSDVANTVTNGMSQLGQFTIYKNNYFKITAGLDVYSIGVSVNASYNQGDWQAAASVGVGIQRDISAGVNVGYRTGNWMFGVSGGYSYNSKGNEWQYGFGATYNQSNSSYTLGFTHYGGDDAQTNWYASYHNGDFSFSMTNDAFLNIVNGNSSDKYRTAGFELGYGNLSIGVSIYTNNPVSESRENWPSPIYGENASGKGAYADGRRIYSAAYFGVSDGNTVSRIGIDSPWIQDAIQNGLHQSKFARILRGGSPYFPTDYSTPASFYLFNRFYSPYSLY